MKFLKLASVAGVLLSSVSLSAAQTLDCTCVTNQSSGLAYPVVGKIAESSGSVMYSGTTGFVEGKAGMEITSGSQINVGPDGKAGVQIGSNCNLAVAQNTEISILQPEGKEGPICVKISEANFGTAQLSSESSTFAQANPAGGTGNQDLYLFLGTIGVVGGVGWAISENNGNRPASP